MCGVERVGMKWDSWDGSGVMGGRCGMIHYDGMACAIESRGRVWHVAAVLMEIKSSNGVNQHPFPAVPAHPRTPLSGQFHGVELGN